MILDKNSCFYLGKITKAKGVRGEAYAFFDADNLETYQNLRSALMDVNGQLQPVFFIKCIIQGDRALVQIENVLTDDAVKMYIGKDLFLPLEHLPPLTGKRFYFHEIIGFNLLNQDNVRIGQIKEVYENGINPLFSVLHESGKEVLIPIHDEVLKKVDRDNKRIYCHLPDGLVELYLG